ncbi:MAG: tetratricopeptide repeat protein [Candidatus Omnitrophica bacterium]|nr:tetratricopeptide repeat protein [Candidatus Omnitrophota bacterium]
MDNLNEKELNKKPAVKKNFSLSFILILVVGIIFAVSAGNSIFLFQKIQAQKKLILQKASEEDELQEAESKLRKKVVELQSELDKLKTEKESISKQNDARLQEEKATAQALLKQAEEKLAQIGNEKKAVQEELAQAKASLSILSQPKEKEKLKQENAEEKQKAKQSKAEEEKLEKERKIKEQEAKREEERKLKLMGNQEITDLKNKLAKAKEQNSALEAKFNSATAKLKQLDLTTTQLLAARKEVERLTQKIISLKKEEEKQRVDSKAYSKKIEEKLVILQGLNTQLENKAKGLYLKLQTAGDSRDQLAHANALLDNLTEERKVVLQENTKLKTQISVLEKEKAQIFQEQGNANMQAKLFDLAIDSYTKSIKLDPNNAEVNYRLGLLYKHTRDDPKKSVYYFRRYLQLNPQAKNRKEVEYLIEALSRGNSWKSIE